MQHLDLQVVRRALEWSAAGQRVWLCTVLATYGSAPRAPGSLLAVNAEGLWIGSLSGGCVEEDFSSASPRVRLRCGQRRALRRRR
jgi:xanthine dehydrogenase accessory factor